jgi:predicted CoA-binding protein
MSESVQKLLAMETWAVVGLSNHDYRAAYDVAKFL